MPDPPIQVGNEAGETRAGSQSFNDLPYCRQETLIIFYWKSQNSTPRRAEISHEKLQQKDDFGQGSFCGLK